MDSFWTKSGQIRRISTPKTNGQNQSQDRSPVLTYQPERDAMQVSIQKRCKKLMNLTGKMKSKYETESSTPFNPRVVGVGHMHSCFFISPSDNDTKALGFRTAYSAMISSTNPYELVTLVGSILCMVAPDLKQDVLVALGCCGITPIEITEREVNESLMVEDVVEVMTPLERNIVWACCVLCLFKNPSHFGNYGQYMTDFIKEIKGLSHLSADESTERIANPVSMDKSIWHIAKRVRMDKTMDKSTRHIGNLVSLEKSTGHIANLVSLDNSMDKSTGHIANLVSLGKTMDNSTRHIVNLVSKDKTILVAFKLNNAKEIRSMLGSVRLLNMKVLTFLMDCKDERKPLTSICQHLVRILAWSEMSGIHYIQETLISTRSRALYLRQISNEVDLLIETMEALRSCEYPQFYHYFAPGEKLHLLDRNRFPILISLALRIKYGITAPVCKNANPTFVAYLFKVHSEFAECSQVKTQK